MKKIIIVLLAIIFLNLSSKIVYAENSGTIANIDIVGQGAVLIEKDSQELIFQKNMDQKMYPASTTKIMTALIALEYAELEDMVTVGNEIDEIPWYSNSANLVAGDQISIHHLLYGLLLPSGNDAANTIASHISKSISANPDLSLQEIHSIFADLMNQKLKELGLNNTNFTNPHGFHHEDQYTTAWDMAIIAKEAMKNQVFREIVSSQEASYYRDEIWENTNHLILEENDNYYPYTIGIKTGKTAAAGKCLVSAATKDNLDLIAVVLNSTDEDVWKDSISLLSYGFENHAIEEPVEEITEEIEEVEEVEEEEVVEEIVEIEDNPDDGTSPRTVFYAIILLVILVGIIIIRRRTRSKKESKTQG